MGSGFLRWGWDDGKRGITEKRGGHAHKLQTCGSGGHRDAGVGEDKAKHDLCEIGFSVGISLRHILAYPVIIFAEDNSPFSLKLITDMKNISILRFTSAILLMAFMTTSCGNAIEEDTNKVLVQYNDAIAQYHQYISETQSWLDHGTMTGLNIYQGTWDKVQKDYKLDSLLNWYYEKHGEKEYNKLRIILDDNFNRKINK